MNKKQTFTLLELIVTVAVLSLGIVFVYEGFFISLGAYSYSRNYLAAQEWMDEALWQAQDKAMRYRTVFTGSQQGEFSKNQKQYTWNASFRQLASTQTMDLYEIILNVQWQEGIRNITLTRATYIDYKKE